MIFIAPLIQFVAILIIAPGVVGLVRLFKARFQNRRGAPVLTPYWQMLSLLKKDMTITRYSSWVFRFVPFAVLSLALLLALCVPTLALAGVPAGMQSVFFIASLLMLGSVFLVFGGMDTASTFGDMGSSREMTLAALVEPALYLSLGALALAAHSWDLASIAQWFAETPWYVGAPFAAIPFVALALVFLSENARYPVDNPATHLELTMVHEAMVLEYSGPYLAMLEYASAVKLTTLFVFLVGLLVPVGMLTAPFSFVAVALALVALLGKAALAAFGIAFIESTVVKMRFYRMQEFMMLAALIAFAGLILSRIVLNA